MRATRLFILFLFAIGAFYFTACATREPVVLGEQTKGSARKREMIRPSGLQPIFPSNVNCPEIASPFGSPTRYDGSSRPSWAPGGGFHGGIDITLADGTPLLALANGMVVAKGKCMLGIYLWLRHSPEDTGLPYWVYSKYQHLQSLPELSIKTKVTMGQVIGRSGITGTTGGHFGIWGYPHLHLTTLSSASGEYQIKGWRVLAPGSRLFDPVVLYNETSSRQEGSARSSLGEKYVAIPYLITDGQVWPQGTRVVWPVACQLR